MTDGILFAQVPQNGFTTEQVEKWVKEGKKIWGIVPVRVVNPSGILLSELESQDTLVLVQDGVTIPVNLLAHHIIRAREEKGGLGYLAKVFYGMSVQELDNGLKAAQKRIKDNA